MQSMQFSITACTIWKYYGGLHESICAYSYICIFMLLAYSCCPNRNITLKFTLNRDLYLQEIKFHVWHIWIMSNLGSSISKHIFLCIRLKTHIKYLVAHALKRSYTLVTKFQYFQKIWWLFQEWDEKTNSVTFPSHRNHF